MIGATIKITGGPYKGNVGIVKDATDTAARVELHSTCQTISVDKSHIAKVGVPGSKGAGSFSSYSRTPSYSTGGQTPMYNRDGGKTPMHGSQTPMYETGSRTPHYGSTTPSHNDGSRTPGQSGAWDPTNTPARSNDFDNYGMDEDRAASGGPFTPQTPGTMYGSEGYSPGAMMATPSPSGYTTTTTNSPHGFGAPSPMGYSPATPGSTGSPYNPQTPLTGLDVNFGAGAAAMEWHTTDIEVRVRDGCRDEALAGQQGSVKSISGHMCTVYLFEEDRTVNLVADELLPVVPMRGDRVKVILGDDREAVGALLSIDNQEGVVQLTNGQVKMLQLRYLCKIKSS